MKLSTEPRENIHYPQTRRSRPPSTFALDKSTSIVKNPAVLTIGSGAATVIAELLTTESSSSNLLGISQSKNGGIVYQSALPPRLYNHPYYKKYFAGKLYLVKKLTDEIFLVEKLNIKEYEIYRQSHCPLITTKNALISHCFAWIRHYQQQILSVLNQKCQLEN